MALALRNFDPSMPQSHAVNALPRLSAEQFACVYLVEAKSGDATELSWSSGLHGTISAMGPYGLQLDAPWECA